MRRIKKYFLIGQFFLFFSLCNIFKVLSILLFNRSLLNVYIGIGYNKTITCAVLILFSKYLLTLLHLPVLIYRIEILLI